MSIKVLRAAVSANCWQASIRQLLFRYEVKGLVNQHFSQLIKTTRDKSKTGEFSHDGSRHRARVWTAGQTQDKTGSLSVNSADRLQQRWIIVAPSSFVLSFNKFVCLIFGTSSHFRFLFNNPTEFLDPINKIFLEPNKPWKLATKTGPVKMWLVLKVQSSLHESFVGSWDLDTRQLTVTVHNIS